MQADHSTIFQSYIPWIFRNEEERSHEIHPSDIILPHCAQHQEKKQWQTYLIYIN